MPTSTSPALAPQAGFDEIAALITAARQRAVQAVNTSLIDLYWQIGKTISRKIQAAQWGDGVVAQLASHLARTQPGLRGFTRANLFRMRQFYDAYRGDEKVSALLRQLPWTHNLIILNQSSGLKNVSSTCVGPSAKNGAAANWSASSRLLYSSEPY